LLQQAFGLTGFAGPRSPVPAFSHASGHWQHLRQQYETQGEKLVLYSCRHGYAHRASAVRPARTSSTVLGGFLRLARCCRIARQTRSASCALWEIIQVEGDDQIGPALDGGSQNMTVIRVW
jgi:hypothetical protein